MLVPASALRLLFYILPHAIRALQLFLLPPDLTESAGGRCYHPGMDIIYIDSLFLLNLAVDYLILLAAGRLCAVRLQRGRYLLAALLGAVWAAATVLPGLTFLSAWPFKLAASGLMALIAYGTQPYPLRCFLAFLGVSFAFGGAVWAASMLGGVSLTSGPTPVTLRVLLLALALTYAAVTLVFRGLTRRSTREIVPVFLGLQGRSVTLRALRDTGNELTDPMTGGRVLVATRAAVLPLLPQAAAAALEHTDALEVFQALGAVPELEGRVRLIPFVSVGASAGLLPALRPDLVCVQGRTEQGALIALSPTPLCPDGGYEALF